MEALKELNNQRKEDEEMRRGKGDKESKHGCYDRESPKEFDSQTGPEPGSTSLNADRCVQAHVG